MNHPDQLPRRNKTNQDIANQIHRIATDIIDKSEALTKDSFKPVQIKPDDDHLDHSSSADYARVRYVESIGRPNETDTYLTRHPDGALDLIQVVVPDNMGDEVHLTKLRIDQTDELGNHAVNGFTELKEGEYTSDHEPLSNPETIAFAADALRTIQSKVSHGQSSANQARALNEQLKL